MLPPPAVTRKGVRIGYVPQDPVFAHGKTIEEVLLEALENDHLLDDYDKQSRIAIALGKSGFMDRTHDTATLSGGWRSWPSRASWPASPT